MPGPSSDDAAATSAAFASFAIIANQVAGKSVRDALFLTHFDVSALPRMFAAAAFLTFGVVLLVARPLARVGPHRLVPAALAASAVVQVAIWFLASAAPGPAAIALYLHLAISGSAIVSWFWSLLSERFDPRTAKRKIAQIAAAGTLGGLGGGLLAMRTAVSAPVTALLPILALFHAAAALFVARIGKDGAPSAGRDDGGLRIAFESLRTPVLRDLALVVAGTASSAILIDFVFKSRAKASFPEAGELLGFFAIYYAGAAVLTFLVQTFLARRLLQRIGLAPTASSLPAATTLLGLAALLVPGLASVAIARGSEATLRASLFRSSYELFYTPMSRRVKRAAKSIIDVGSDRLGEGVGALVVQLTLAVGIASPEIALLALAVAVALGCLWLTPRLHAGYVRALEERLLDPAEGIDPQTIEDETTRSTVMRTLHAMSTGSISVAPGSLLPAGDAASVAAAGKDGIDPVLAQLAVLRSGDPIRVRAALASNDPFDALLIPQAIQLLAWDAVAADAGRALARGATRWTGQLADALLDPDSEFAIRRRVPRLLARSDSERAVDALNGGLRDARFEVRYRCANALVKLRDRRVGEGTLDAAALLDVAVREASADRHTRRPETLLDHEEEDSRETPNLSLRYVGLLLSLAFPKAQLDAALDCLERGDARLRGTALEYLETLLPPSVRDPIVRFMERAAIEAASVKSTRVSREAASDEVDAVGGALLRSHETVRLSLEQIRRGKAAGERSDG